MAKRHKPEEIICRDRAGIDRKALADAGGRHARLHHALEHAPEDDAVAEALVASARGRPLLLAQSARVVRTQCLLANGPSDARPIHSAPWHIGQGVAVEYTSQSDKSLQRRDRPRRAYGASARGSHDGPPGAERRCQGRRDQKMSKRWQGWTIESHSFGTAQTEGALQFGRERQRCWRFPV
jgi:hypothetical protein